MATAILWTGVEYYSLEHCLVEHQETKVHISSFIVGTYEGQSYRLKYDIETDDYWRTQTATLEYYYKNEHHRKQLVHMRESWTMNGQLIEAFADCIDVDIRLTPFTNTLPINRLKLDVGNEQVINVIYLDILANEFHAVSQLYRRLSATAYHYENVPNDFEADIEVDEEGFVDNYPELFKRTQKQGSLV